LRRKKGSVLGAGRQGTWQGIGREVQSEGDIIDRSVCFWLVLI
jgi:hypothetical protein